VQADLNDKSASKGEQQAELDEMLDDMRHGMFKVLVCWHSDRVERRGPEALFKLLRQIKDAGGRIESTKEPLFGTDDLSGEAMTAIGAVMAHQYAVHLGEQVRAGHDKTRANNGVINRVPWGYTIEGAKHYKNAIPTDECREYWPKVLDRCIAGDSCRTIAKWLDSENVSTRMGGKWNEGEVLRLIHNPIYCGRRLGWAGDKLLLKDEAVVPVDKWVLANEALANRPKRGPVAKTSRPLLANLKCLRCGAPMYRKVIGGRLSRRYCYRCEGRGPQRKGCGNLVPYAQTEIIVTVRIFEISTKPYRTKVWAEGKNWDAEIADIRQQMRELDPESDEDEARRVELKARLKEYRRKNEEEATTGGWQYVDTGMTVGQHFRQLDWLDKREFLKNYDIRAERVTLEYTPEDMAGIRVVIDGEDQGAFLMSNKLTFYQP
jgi:DNA invertase Pin-like site-specific DNA recombinase